MNKVLIIDDDKNIRDLFEDLFKNELKFEEIALAEDGLDGVMQSRDAKYDIIILDQTMPNLSGLDFLDVIRSTDNPNQFTPVILITGSMPIIPTNKVTIENTLYLMKPINVEKITRFVKMYKHQKQV